MRTVVITGSTRGIGYALARYFLDHQCNVVINGTSKESVDKALKSLGDYGKSDYLQGVIGDVSNYETHLELCHVAETHFDGVDIWVNNAGIDQHDELFYNHDIHWMRKVVDVNVIGVLFGMKAAYNHMSASSGHGFIYNMEGFGSDDRMMPKLSIYGTSKRALRYATRSMANEIQGSDVRIGALSPGMVATDFLKATLTGDPKEVERRRRIYNILADRPEDVAEFLGSRIITNQKNNAHIAWLTPWKAFCRFMTAPIVKRTIFEEE